MLFNPTAAGGQQCEGATGVSGADSRTMTLWKTVQLSGGEGERHELPVRSARLCTHTRRNAQEDLRTLTVEGVYFCASVRLSDRGTPGETAVDAECLHQPEQHSLHPLLPPSLPTRRSVAAATGTRACRR
ncbi:hypothetical protein AAFF_G00018730 [Aldrovandia affinis]|uniref:Uncharacterized protein n=1 Tax=Aldrovandia affinis TaxID=143900 RepID=A0AAD7WGJ2_9TELE|nr:hypothetical protein AAFF_G00018730 [Aldrovandia affinis]